MKDALIERLKRSGDKLLQLVVALMVLFVIMGLPDIAKANDLSPSIAEPLTIDKLLEPPASLTIDDILATEASKIPPPKAKPAVKRRSSIKLPPTPTAAWIAQYSSVVKAAAVANNLPPNLIMAVIAVESGYRAKATSGTSHGLMQIKLATAREYGLKRGSVQSLYDPSTNIRIASTYLAAAYQRSGGNVCATISRYNRGLYSKGVNADYCAKVAQILRLSAYRI